MIFIYVLLVRIGSWLVVKEGGVVSILDRYFVVLKKNYGLVSKVKVEKGRG